MDHMSVAAPLNRRCIETTSENQQIARVLLYVLNNVIAIIYNAIVTILQVETHASNHPP